MIKSPLLLRDWDQDHYLVHLYRHSAGLPLPEPAFNFLYNSHNYLYSHTSATYYSFFLYQKDRMEIIAFIHFNRDEQASSLISLDKAPFGGLESGRFDSVNAINFLLQCVNQWASADALKSVSIKCPVNPYNPVRNENYIEHYLDNGYSVTKNLVNHLIPISETSFENLIAHQEKRRLAKCKKQGFVVAEVNSLPLKVMYEFISKVRAEKNYPLTTSLETLQNLAIKSPQSVLSFAILDSDTLIALAITVRVSEKVLYNFLPATATDYKSFSPMVLLTETLFKYCQKYGISFLDLGTSCDHNGQPKPGLLQFKQNIGGVPFSKLTLTYYPPQFPGQESSRSVRPPFRPKMEE